MHVLITRFNVRYPKSTMPDAPEVTYSYTQARWDIFEKFTLPSVVRQIKRPDLWVIYFDEVRSTSIRAKIDALSNTHDFISTCFVSSKEEILPDLQARCPKGEETFITSRLDNDDILHPLFIQDVQIAATAQIADACIIDFPLYFNYRFGSKLLYQTERNFITPFASLVERRTQEVPPSTILVDEHTRLRHAVGLVRYLYTPRTMATLHETNVVNGKNRRRLRDILLGRAKKHPLSEPEAKAVLLEFGIGAKPMPAINRITAKGAED